MPSQPSTFLNWTNGTSPAVIQPPSSLQMSGWSPAQAPPFEYMNWLFWLTDQWIQYFATLNTVNLAPNMRLITAGTFNYIDSTGVLTWSDEIDLQVPGLLDSYNALAAGSVTLTDGDIAYVSVNLPISSRGSTATGNNQILGLTITQGITSGMNIIGGGFSGATVLSIVGNTVTASSNSTAGASNTPITFANSTALTATVVQNSTIVPTQSTFVFARKFGSVVYVGINDNGMLMQDGETKTFLGTGYLNTFTALAGVTLTAGQAVYIATSADTGNTTGSLYPVDATNAVRNSFAGFVMTNVTGGDLGSVVNSGSVPMTGLTAGSIYYVDPATPGAITATQPTSIGQYIIAVGIAVSATELLTSFSNPEIIGGSGGGDPTFQLLTSSGDYNPTSGAVKFAEFLLIGGGGGGGCSGNSTAGFASAGGPGGTTTLDSGAHQAGGGSGGGRFDNPTQGGGGGFGFGGGSYVFIDEASGGDGGGGQLVGAATNLAAVGGVGGNSVKGGGGGPAVSGAGGGTTWGGGGAGGSATGALATNTGGGGGAGGMMTVGLSNPAVYITANYPGVGIPYVIGGAGTGGAAGGTGNNHAGANGFQGYILVRETY